MQIQIRRRRMRRLYRVYTVSLQYVLTKFELKGNRPLAGYGLHPPRGDFVDHIFLEAKCLARILQNVCPLARAALSCNSLLYTLPYKIFDGNIKTEGAAMSHVPIVCVHYTCSTWLAILIYESRHNISSIVVCATNKGLDQPAHTSSLIRVFASRLNILWVLSYWLNIIWSCFA